MGGLIERLEAGAGPDRELDAEIHKLVAPDDVRRFHALYQGMLAEARANGLTNRDRACWDYGYGGCPRYTSSLDAATELVEKVLPGWQFTIYHDGAQVSTDKPPSLFWGRSKSRPRALCAAFLKAARSSLEPPKAA